MVEVTSSPPAVKTRVSATPKTSPCTSFVAGDPAARKGPAAETMSTTAMPMYDPASIDCTVYAMGRRVKATLVAADFAW